MWTLPATASYSIVLELFRTFNIEIQPAPSKSTLLAVRQTQGTWQASWIDFKLMQATATSTKGRNPDCRLTYAAEELWTPR